MDAQMSDTDVETIIAKEQKNETVSVSTHHIHYSMVIRFMSYHCLSCKSLMKHCRIRYRNRYRIRIRYRYRIRVSHEYLYFSQENKGIVQLLKFTLTPEFNICRIIRSTLKLPLTPKTKITGRKSSTYTKKATHYPGRLFSLVVVCVLENGDNP